MNNSKGDRFPTILERRQYLIELGFVFSECADSELISAIKQAELSNPWFTQTNIEKSLDAIRVHFLSSESLDLIILKYHLDDSVIPKRIGLIPAGNIPLVGFHDLMICYLLGHYIQIKYSDKDTPLMKYVGDFINSRDSRKPISSVEKLSGYEAIIATGSDNSAKLFKYYFSDVPHIIRHNRTSVAVLTGEETDEQLKALGDDIFSYFGLGCRNVGKLFLPKNYDLNKIFQGLSDFESVINHHKYKNNYDYNKALWLLGKEEFYHNDFISLKVTRQLHARLGSVNIEYYDDLNDFEFFLEENKNKLQCVVASFPINNHKTVPFGMSQYPSIDDFADNIDTVQFLLQL